MACRAAWRRASRGLNWRDELLEPEDEQIKQAICACTWTGRPLGSDRFIAKLEVLVSRRLRALHRGRPKKANRK
jgi:hypothetical protein